MQRCCIQVFHTNFNQSVLLEIAQAMIDTVRNPACCADRSSVTHSCVGGGGWRVLCSTCVSGVLGD